MVHIKRCSWLLILLALVCQVHAAVPLSRWMGLDSDARERVRGLIRSEVDEREGYSTSEEERVNLQAVEAEKARDDAAYKDGIIQANKEFVRAKKRRDDLTSQFQAASTELEESGKNVKTTKVSIENLDSQVARYEQDIQAQQASLKKWLQTEKQGEALVAVIYTRGFRDKAHSLDSLADQASAPAMAQHMGTYIQSFSKVINNALSLDFIRAIEEGTAKWTNEEPVRIELDKGAKGTTYLRLKRYELYPFQDPKRGRIKAAAAGSMKVAIITSRKDLDAFVRQNQYSIGNDDLSRFEGQIRETAQNNALAEENLNEQVKSFRERIGTLRDRIATARQDRDTQRALLKKREDQFGKMAQELEALRGRKDAAEKSFSDAQTVLQEKKRVHESIIIKTALATTKGSQSPAEASAESIIDKLAEVKNDAKTQHSSSTTEVTDFRVTAESSLQAVTEARIISVRLISFINEGDSVRVKMAFRVRTVLEDRSEAAPARKAPDGRKSFIAAAADEEKPKKDKEKPKKKDVAKKRVADRTPPAEPEPVKAAPIKRNYPVLATVEMKECLFELRSAALYGQEIHILIEVTNTEKEANRSVAFYDASFGNWAKSTLVDDGGKSYDVSEVQVYKGDKKATMLETGKQGVEIGPGEAVTLRLIFRKVPASLRTIKTLNLHPFVYFRRMIGTSWQEGNLPIQAIRLAR